MWITRVIAAAAITIGLSGIGHAATMSPMSPMPSAAPAADSDALLQLIGGGYGGGGGGYGGGGYGGGGGGGYGGGWGPPPGPPSGGWGPPPPGWGGPPKWCNRNWKFGWVKGYGKVWYRYVGPYCRLEVAPQQRAPGVGGCIQVGPSVVCGGVPF